MNIGINEAKETGSLQIISFPNPVEGHLIFQFSKTLPNTVDLFIYNLYGQQVYHHEIAKNELQYSAQLRELQSGVYFYSIRNNSDILASGKIIKK